MDRLSIDMAILKQSNIIFLGSFKGLYPPYI